MGCEATVESLRTENQDLRRELRIAVEKYWLSAMDSNYTGYEAFEVPR